MQWNSELFAPIRAALREQHGCSEEEAVVRLQNMWTADLNQRANTPQSPPPLPPPPIPPPRSVSPETEPPQLPAQRKRIIADFDPNVTISDMVPRSPARYAIDKIKTMEYVELWYFTTEGIRDTSRVSCTAADNALGLLQTDAGIMAFQQVKATKVSRNVRNDESLSWDQISTARHNIVAAANAWPEKLKQSLADFFMNLEALVADGYDTRAIVQYQAVSRRRWHEAMLGEHQMFNISHINMNLLANLKTEMQGLDIKDLQRQASKIFPHSTSRHNANHDPPPFFFPPTSPSNMLRFLLLASLHASRFAAGIRLRFARTHRFMPPRHVAPLPPRSPFSPPLPSHNYQRICTPATSTGRSHSLQRKSRDTGR